MAQPHFELFQPVVIFLSFLFGLMPFGILGLTSIGVLGKSDSSIGSCSYQETDIIYQEKIFPIFTKSWKSSRFIGLTAIYPI